MRAHFQVVAVTVGPKRSQKGQKIDENGQGWNNPSFDENPSANDQVFRVKVRVAVLTLGEQLFGSHQMIYVQNYKRKETVF